MKEPSMKDVHKILGTDSSQLWGHNDKRKHGRLFRLGHLLSKEKMELLQKKLAEMFPHMNIRVEEQYRSFPRTCIRCTNRPARYNGGMKVRDLIAHLQANCDPENEVIALHNTWDRHGAETESEFSIDFVEGNVLALKHITTTPL